MLEQGAKPGFGSEKIFEVRDIKFDISFIRNYLTKDLVEQEDLYLFEKQGAYHSISNKDMKKFVIS